MEPSRGGRPRHPDILTPAEWRVLRELREGGTNAEIAVRLGVSPDAVKYHISNMLSKLALEDRHQLAAWRAEEGRRWGWLALPATLGAIGRPLLWAGGGMAAAGAVAAVVAVVVVLTGGEPTEEPTPFVESWAELNVDVPEIVYLGEFTEEERAEIARELRRVQVNYQKFFGAVTSDFTLYISTDLDLLNERYQARGTAEDEPTPVWFSCGGLAPQEAILVVLETCRGKMESARRFIAHEYFHTLQQATAPRFERLPVETYYPWAPTRWLNWLVEGAAEYAADLHDDAEGRMPMAFRLSGLELVWSRYEKPLPRGVPENEDVHFFSYTVGALAMGWLAERAGSEALLDIYWTGARSDEAFDAAFAEVFGLTLDEFYAGFEAYRQRVTAPLVWRIAGRVLAPNGGSVPANVLAMEPAGAQSVLVAGPAPAWQLFDFKGPGSGFVVRVIIPCPDVSQRDDRSWDGWIGVGDFGRDGFVASRDGDPFGPVLAEPFREELDRTGLLIRLPEAPGALFARHCGEAR